MQMAWSPITRGRSPFSNGARLISTGGSSGRITRCHTAPSCALQSMKMVFIASARLLDRPPDLADLVDLLQPDAGVAAHAVEHVGDLVILDFAKPLADLGQRHGAAEVNAIDDRADDDGEQHQQ